MLFMAVSLAASPSATKTKINVVIKVVMVIITGHLYRIAVRLQRNHRTESLPYPPLPDVLMLAPSPLSKLL